MKIGARSRGREVAFHFYRSASPQVFSNNLPAMGLCDTFTSLLHTHNCIAITLSAVGAAVVTGVGLSFVQFLLQTFILSGQNVGLLQE